MYKMIKQYAEKIKRTFSFFDRIIINSYIRPLCWNIPVLVPCIRSVFFINFNM